MVRSPASNQPSPCLLTPVEAKVISGYFSASKKSSLRRWPSRLASLVLTDAVLIVAAAAHWAG